jgi:hypothetical protein
MSRTEGFDLMAHAEGGQESLPGRRSKSGSAGDQFNGEAMVASAGSLRGSFDKIGSDVQSQARNSTGSANSAFSGGLATMTGGGKSPSTKSPGVPVNFDKPVEESVGSAKDLLKKFEKTKSSQVLDWSNSPPTSPSSVNTKGSSPKFFTGTPVPKGLPSVSNSVEKAFKPAGEGEMYSGPLKDNPFMKRDTAVKIEADGGESMAAKATKAFSAVGSGATKAVSAVGSWFQINVAQAVTNNLCVPASRKSETVNAEGLPPTVKGADE